MSQAVWTETTCDRCRKLDRQQIVLDAGDLPEYWVQIETTRHISKPVVSAMFLTDDVQRWDGMLCEKCWDDWLDWMKPAKDADAQLGTGVKGDV